MREYLGPSCVPASEQLVDFDAVFAITEPTMPIVLISSTDHTLPFLQQFAEARGANVLHMAIGRGQGAATDKLIRASVGERWVDGCGEGGRRGAGWGRAGAGARMAWPHA